MQPPIDRRHRGTAKALREQLEREGVVRASGEGFTGAENVALMRMVEDGAAVRLGKGYYVASLLAERIEATISAYKAERAQVVAEILGHRTEGG